MVGGGGGGEASVIYVNSALASPRRQRAPRPRIPSRAAEASNYLGRVEGIRSP